MSRIHLKQLDSSGATTGQVATFDGTNWVPAASGGGDVFAYTFQPGGTAAGFLYTTWATVYAAIVAQRTAEPASRFFLTFDNTLGAITIPAGTYDLEHVALFGFPNDPNVTNLVAVTFADGAFFTNLHYATNLRFNASLAGLNIPMADGQVLIGEHSLFVAGDGQLFNLSALPTSGAVRIELRDASEIRTLDAINFSTANAATLTIVTDKTSKTDTEVVSDGGAGVSTLIYQMSSVFPVRNANFTGTRTYTHALDGWNNVLDPATLNPSEIGLFDLSVGSDSVVLANNPEFNTGAQILVKNTSSNATNTLTVANSGTGTVEGGATYVLSGAFCWALFVCDGVGNWNVASQGPVGSSSGAIAVIFDDFVPANKVNIRSDRATNQSPIDNTKAGITNLGSDNGSFMPGVLGDYGTNSGGLNNSIRGNYNACLGGHDNISDGLTTIVGGNSNVASSDGSVAVGGSGNLVDTSCDNGVCVGGNGNALSIDAANSATIGGTTNVIQAQNAFATGEACTITGAHSQAMGSSCTSSAAYTTTTGRNSEAVLVGQRVHSGGAPSLAVGEAQESAFTVYGTTPGAGAGESVSLLIGEASAAINLSNNVGTAFTILVTVIAKGDVSGTERLQSFRQLLCVEYTAGGTLQLIDVGTQEQIGSAAAASWTLTASVSSPNLVLTFNTGSTTALTRVFGKVEMVEVVRV